MREPDGQTRSDSTQADHQQPPGQKFIASLRRSWPCALITTASWAIASRGAYAIIRRGHWSNGAAFIMFLALMLASVTVLGLILALFTSRNHTTKSGR